MKKKIVYSLLGPTLDQGFGNNRWNRWRPSVSICQHEDFLVDEYHVLYQETFKKIFGIVLGDINSVSPETRVVQHLINFDDPWDFEEVYEILYSIIGGQKFNPEENEYFFHITTGTHVAQICIFLLTEARFFPGKLLQTSPDRDCTGIYTIIDLDLSRYDRIASRFRKEFNNDLTFLKSGINTKNYDFNKMIEQIEYVAIRTFEPLFFTGPTGAGKSHLSRRIFELKKQKGIVKGGFVEINCATLRGDTAMSALFGHKKGAFTGAVSDRSGLLKAADEGILFLDEIGELGLDEQTMLLQAIEEKRFMPVGADAESKSNFQLICGTNRDLREDVAAGKFREDLLARINLWTFCLPGLRDRPEDIEPNLQYELSRYEQKYGVHVTFNKEAKDDFLAFAMSKQAVWTANFRDLNAAIVRMSTLAPGGRITRGEVKEEIERLLFSWDKPRHNSYSTAQKYLSSDIWAVTDPFDLVQLENVLKVCEKSTSLSEAGRKLFCHSRLGKNKPNDSDRLRKYLAKYGISWNDFGNGV